MKKSNLENYEVDKGSKRGVRYVGIYYTTDMPAEERRKNGLLQILAGIVQMMLIFSAITLNSVGTRTIYVIIPLECILFCSLYYMIGSYTFWRSENKMEQKDYERAIENPVQIALVAVILNIVSCIGQSILIIRKASVLNGYKDYVLLGMLIVLLVLHIIMWKHQKMLFERTKSIRQENN